MSLDFSDSPYAWDGTRMCVNFKGKNDGKSVLCRVSIEALQDQCGLRSSEAAAAVEAFLSNRSLIEAIASHKFATGQVENDGTVKVFYNDF